MTRRGRLAGLLCVILLIGSATVVVADSSDYALQVSGSMETPPRTITLQGTQFTVSSLAVRDPGEDLLVNVTAPDSVEYTVLLVTANKDLWAAKSGTGPGQVAFATTGMEPGSYLLALEQNKTIRAIHPLLIPGYELTLKAPQRACINTTVTVTVDVRQTARPASLSGVEIVFATEQRTFRGSATKQDANTYTSTFKLPPFLDPGNYSLSAAAKSTETTTIGRQEVIGVSRVQPMHVVRRNTTQTGPSNACLTTPAQRPTGSPTHVSSPTPSPTTPDAAVPNLSVTPTADGTAKGTSSPVLTAARWGAVGILLGIGYWVWRSWTRTE